MKLIYKPLFSCSETVWSRFYCIVVLSIIAIIFCTLKLVVIQSVECPSKPTPNKHTTLDITRAKGDEYLLLYFEKLINFLSLNFMLTIGDCISVSALETSRKACSSIYLCFCCTFIQKWTNPFLEWDPKKYGDIKTIHVQPKNVWVPDTALINK